MGRKNYTTASCEFNILSIVVIDTLYCVLIKLDTPQAYLSIKAKLIL